MAEHSSLDGKVLPSVKSDGEAAEGNHRLDRKHAKEISPESSIKSEAAKKVPSKKVVISTVKESRKRYVHVNHTDTDIRSNIIKRSPSSDNFSDLTQTNPPTGFHEINCICPDTI